MKNACGKDKGRTKQLATCLSSFLHRISDAVTTSSIPQHFSCQLSAPSDNPSSNEHSTSGQHPSPDPHPPLKPGRYEAGPTMCSTSRAVYLLIASLTIAHNNQLRHCQRNTHSWHRTRREVRVGWSVSSFLLIHRRQESGDKQGVNEVTEAALKETALQREEAQTPKLIDTLFLNPSLN